MRYSNIEGLDLLPVRAFQKVAGKMTYEGGGGGNPAPPANTTSVQTKEIPAWAQPYAQEILTRGAALSNTPFQNYEGERIAEMSPYQMAGLDMTANIAQYGTPGTNAAMQNYADTMSGAYMSPDSNPYLQATVDRALGDVRNQVQSQFGGSNYGTSANQELLTRNMAQAASDIYGQNYSAERLNQIRGQALMPQFQQSAYQDAQNLVGVGDIYRQEGQDMLNLQYQDWAAQQNQPYRQLDVLANALGAAVNGQGSVQSAGYDTSGMYTPNRYASALGGGLAGAGLGNMIGGSDYAGYGAAAGGLLGAFS